MTSPQSLRRASAGEAVRNLQERLAAAGHSFDPDPAGTFGPGTEAAVRAFQEKRALHVDGICGPETWSALVESSFRFGDRLLSVRRPMLRGDDVAEVQHRLNALGFDAGREDGIFGPQTEAAVRQFQRNAGVSSDGVFGPATRVALDRLGTLAAGSVASTREREMLRRPGSLRGHRIYLVGAPEFAALAEAVGTTLTAAGAQVTLDESAGDDSAIAARANEAGAGLLLALRTSAEGGRPRSVHFASRSFRSEAGYCLALHLDHELGAALGDTEGPVGRNYVLLRETRMAAVICELAPGVVGAALDLPDLAAAIGRGVRRGVEAPLDGP